MKAIPAQGRPFKVYINGHDVSDLVSSIGWSRDSLSFTQGEILHWRGSLTLSKRLSPPNTFNIDDRKNPSLRKGSVVNIWVTKGRSYVLERTLRIKRAIYDRATESTTIELIDILELLSYKGDAETDVLKQEKYFKEGCITKLPNEMIKTYSLAARELLIKAGIPETKISLPQTISKIDFFLDKGTESYITLAAKLMFTELYFLEVSANETIVATEWRTNFSGRAFARNEIDLISIQRVQPPEDSFSVIKASCNRKKALTIERKSTKSNFYETIDSSSFGETSKTIISGYREIFHCFSDEKISPPSFDYRFGYSGTSFSLTDSISINGRPYTVAGVPGVTQKRDDIFRFSASSEVTGRIVYEEKTEEITNFEKNNPNELGRKEAKSYSSRRASYNEKGFAVTEGELKVRKIRKRSKVNVEGGYQLNSIEDDESLEQKQISYSISSSDHVLRITEKEKFSRYRLLLVPSNGGDLTLEEKFETEIIEKITNKQYIKNGFQWVESVSERESTRKKVFSGILEYIPSSGVLYVIKEMELIDNINDIQTRSEINEIDSPPSPKTIPAKAKEEESLIEASYEIPTRSSFSRTEKRINVEYVQTEEQLRKIAEAYAQFLAFKQNEIEVAIEPILFDPRPFLVFQAHEDVLLLDAVAWSFTENSIEQRFSGLGIGFAPAPHPLPSPLPKPIDYTPPDFSTPTYPPSYSTPYIPPPPPPPPLTLLNPGNFIFFKGVNVGLISLTAYGGNSSNYVFSAIGLPPALFIDPDDGFISGVVNQVGTFPVTASVFDGTSSASTSFTITVEDPPLAYPILPQVLTLNAVTVDVTTTQIRTYGSKVGSIVINSVTVDFAWIEDFESGSGSPGDWSSGQTIYTVCVEAEDAIYIPPGAQVIANSVASGGYTVTNLPVAPDFSSVDVDNLLTLEFHISEEIKPRGYTIRYQNFGGSNKWIYLRFVVKTVGGSPVIFSEGRSLIPGWNDIIINLVDEGYITETDVIQAGTYEFKIGLYGTSTSGSEVQIDRVCLLRLGSPIYT